MKKNKLERMVEFYGRTILVVLGLLTFSLMLFASVWLYEPTMFKSILFIISIVLLFIIVYIGGFNEY